MSVKREQMKRKYGQAIASIDKCQTYLLEILYEFGEGRDMIMFIDDYANDRITSENYRYAKYARPLVIMLLNLEDVSQIIQKMLDEYKGIE